MNIKTNQPIANCSPNSSCYRLILVTNQQNIPQHHYLKFIHDCAKSGVTAVQLREKQMPYDALLEFGKKIIDILTPLNIPLIVNDNLQLALDLDAAGVHLGQTDHCPQEARAALGVEKIIGVSIDSLANLQKANQLPINYVGIGSIFPTQHKTNVPTFWGVAGLKKLAPLSRHPIVAIGGINENNAHDVILAGAKGIAAIGAFHHTLNLHKTTQKLLHMIQGYNHD